MKRLCSLRNRSFSKRHILFSTALGWQDCRFLLEWYTIFWKRTLEPRAPSTGYTPSSLQVWLSWRTRYPRGVSMLTLESSAFCIMTELLWFMQNPYFSLLLHLLRPGVKLMLASNSSSGITIVIYQKIVCLFLRIEHGSHLAMLRRDILSFDKLGKIILTLFRLFFATNLDLISWFQLHTLMTIDKSLVV